ncbi:hypothetical protein L5515_007446 [Caenorhabditis briggsae]|uniref:Uncharacterized protein n=1 Tax=Caenorhabditis briggsae TaxID=6238 RepID=A0AAE9EYJ9_CAEBR|nr:hypothetical protein L5515_007446 [Caenorhabditis briggsae]
MGNCIVAGARGSLGFVPSRMYSGKNSSESIQEETALKPATKKQMVRYYRRIQEIEKTTTGIVNIFNDAAENVDKTDEFNIILQSLLTRLLDLHKDLNILIQFSFYKIDFSVHERKDLAEKIKLLVSNLWNDIKGTLEGNPFGFAEIEIKMENLVKQTGDLIKIV